MKTFDLTGIGLNSVDTLVLARRFPGYAGKEPFDEEIVSPGGQIASAVVAVARLGLRTRYIGTVGDDPAGALQLESLRHAGINVDAVEIREGCASQTAYIVIDRSTGERTVLWRRPEGLSLAPERITDDTIDTRMLLVDGYDTPAVAKAAELARARRIPVAVDVDTVYPGFESVLKSTDYLIASSGFPAAWTGLNDPFDALERIAREYRMRVAAMTLGSAGALALRGGEFLYSPGFVVDCVDTTGAGDVFHGAFCYSVLGDMQMRDTLDFSNAMAALNCLHLGARGGIATEIEARNLIERGERRSDREFARAARPA